MTLTVEDFAWRWLAQRHHRGRPLDARTLALYAGQLRRDILPTLGTVPLAELTRAHVRTWSDERCSDTGPGRLSAAKCYRLLRAICTTAVEDELLAATPCTLRGAGDEWSPERPILSVPQVLALADAVAPPYRALVLLGAFCCLRFGELSALRRSAVDLDGPTVTVLATAGQASGQGRVIGPPKSAAGRRTLTIPAAVVPDIARHLHALPTRQPGSGRGSRGGAVGAGRTREEAGSSLSPARLSRLRPCCSPTGT